ncbi:hypothetical protein CC86DRAFT_464737 [Ophiobolus disseminans]|uniref:Uncharacterized protein n=1 Tax=Ophiobolus disseminans TaxID=1469910 RepID=A0A6A7A8F3_9PLEO|nr:hypothetical protein CC86DRAFT_464737 [Ophiobolus disseminans]
MSPPNATPQPDDAPTTITEQKLGNVIDQEEWMSGLQKEPSSESSKPAESGQDAPKATATGQATNVVTEGHVGVEKADTDGEEHNVVSGSKPALNGSRGPAEIPAEAPKPAPGQPVDDGAAHTDLIDLSSTPPREPSSKAAGKAAIRSPSPPPPPPKDEKYLTTSNVPSRATSPISLGKSSGRNSEDAAAADYAGKFDGHEDAVDDSQSEIQSIMGQFEQEDGGLGADEIMSPRLELASPLLESPTTGFPPRRSSLVPLDKPLPTPSDDTASVRSPQSPPARTSSLYRVGTNASFTEPVSPSAHAPKYQPAQPAPEPEPDLPFDFHRFLEQLRHRTADPVAKFLRSFLLEFGKKQWMVHEQVKIIGDFLEFISKKMAQCEVWRTVSDAEFDNAREGMEKLVMNRLYNQTFSPAIAPPEPSSPRKGRRRQDPPGPGRRGQHQEDVERDEVLAQKVRIYKWVSEEHLDIKPVGDKGRKFLNLAQQELLKIKSYRAPRDKIICVLNCCKVIFGFLRTSKSDQSADAFVPLLIYTVLQANPDHLVSNVQYILRFRNQDKLGGEAGYYISSLMGAVQFIEGLDKTSLTVTDEEFEKNVEAAVSAIAERHAEAEASTASTHLHPSTPGHRRMPSPHYHHLSEKGAPLRPEITTRNSMEAERATPRRSTSVKDRKAETDPPEEENAAVAGLLRTIQRPLSTIGRIFSDTDTSTSASGPANTPPQNTTPRPPAQPPRPAAEFPGQAAHSQQQQYSEKSRSSHDDPRQRASHDDPQRQRLSAEESAARQASAEAEQARRIQVQENKVVVETLQGMFPQLDRDVIVDVVRQKEGRVGLAVDACLALANP